MILLAHAVCLPSRFRESSLTPYFFLTTPSAENSFPEGTLKRGEGVWRERITQFRHVTIPRLEKPTNFKTNGTVISTPDMTNSRPFLSCILPFLCIVASFRSPAAFPHHCDFPLHVMVKKGTLWTGFPSFYSHILWLSWMCLHIHINSIILLFLTKLDEMYFNI